MRTCRVCGESLPLTRFYTHPTQSGVGYGRRCRACVIAGVRANRELKRAYYKAYERKRYMQRVRDALNAACRPQ